APLAGMPRPKVRLQAPEEILPQSPPRTPLPSPEELGIGGPVGQIPNAPLAAAPVANVSQSRSEDIDWNVTKQRLNRLGALSFHCDRLANGAFRVTLSLPAQGGAHHVEAEATSEAAAVAAAIDRAEAWASRR